MYYKNAFREYSFRLLVAFLAGFVVFLMMQHTYSDFKVATIGNYHIYVTHFITGLCFYFVFRALRESKE